MNENYDYSFNNDESAKWVRFVDPEVLLQPHEKKKVSYSLAVPAAATPGAYDIALLTTIQGETSNSSINEYHRVASLIYLDVGGVAESKGTVLGFDLPWLTTSNNIGYKLRVANQGNTHLEFDVRIDSRFAIGGSHNQTSATTFTLPRSVRSISDSTQIGSVPGLYTVSANYSPPSGEKQTITKRVLYIPWAFTYSMLALLGIVIFAAFERWKIFGRKSKTKD